MQCFKGSVLQDALNLVFIGSCFPIVSPICKIDICCFYFKIEVAF